MSYRISYLVPKKEFEHLRGKKQPQSVSVMNKKSLEVASKKSSTPRRCTKPKTAAEMQVRCRKPKSPNREKTQKLVKQSSVKKKHKQDPWAW